MAYKRKIKRTQKLSKSRKTRGGWRVKPAKTLKLHSNKKSKSM